ncbi:MAG: methionine--tRNA ligase [Candidatus Roizmanbacteria bacterium]
MNKKSFYITTTAPYVNADPHIGFALEIIQADAIARFHRLLGEEVAFGFGTDEHGVKIYRKAQEEEKDPQKYCDEYAKKFDDLKTALNLTYTLFIRTTNPKHIKAAQEFWQRCYKKGDIYKKNYRIKYCVGCELEKTDSELENGFCPLHPNLKIEIYDEENYFFRFSKYQKKLLELYDKNPDFVVPKNRLLEIKTFVEKGLEDFSVSRLKKKMSWGIDIPGDPDHVMYVWFDALVFYISTLGWPNNEKEFSKFWPGVQVAGKDNLRQQTAIWQAMLMSAGLSNSKQVFIHGFITANGQKMSKSLGNVINPFHLVKKYGTDAVRYYLLKEIPSDDDGDFSYRRMEEIYNADLANELGNLVSRLTNLAEKDSLTVNNEAMKQYNNEIIEQFYNFQFNLILENIWIQIKKLNKQIDEFAPWNKKQEERKDFLLQSINALKSIGWQLQPFLPETAEKIIKSTQGKIKKIPALFPRLK